MIRQYLPNLSPPSFTKLAGVNKDQYFLERRDLLGNSKFYFLDGRVNDGTANNINANPAVYGVGVSSMDLKKSAIKFNNKVVPRIFGSGKDFFTNYSATGADLEIKGSFLANKNIEKSNNIDPELCLKGCNNLVQFFSFQKDYVFYLWNYSYKTTFDNLSSTDNSLRYKQVEIISIDPETKQGLGIYNISFSLKLIDVSGVWRYLYNFSPSGILGGWVTNTVLTSSLDILSKLKTKLKEYGVLKYAREFIKKKKISFKKKNKDLKISKLKSELLDQLGASFSNPYGVSIALLTSTTATALVCNYGNGTVTPMSYTNGTWTAGTAITGFSNPYGSLYCLTHLHHCHSIGM